MTQRENGQRVATKYGEVVPADIVAKLSGVSMSNVSKVMAAQWVLSQEGVIPAEQLTDFGGMPSALPDETRATLTDRIYEKLCTHCRNIPAPALRKLSKRFREHVTGRVL